MFNLRKDAQNLSVDEVKNKLKTLTQGQKSDNVLNMMASTFKALCDLADWSETKTTIANTSDDTIEKEKTVKEMPQKNNGLQVIAGKENEIGLHYNIQIHLPETTNMAVYDAIFQSLKKHLF